MTRAEQKAVTAKKIAKNLEDTDDIEAIKACSKCGRMYLFYAEDSTCIGCGEGNLLPLSQYLPVIEE